MRVLAIKQFLTAEVIVVSIKSIVRVHLAIIEFLLMKIIVLTIKAVVIELLLTRHIRHLPIQRQALAIVEQAVVLRPFLIRKVIAIVTGIPALLTDAMKE